MGAGIPLLMREIGREIKDEPTGTIAAWIGVFQINLIFWTGYILTEGLFIPFLVLTFYLVVRLLKRDTPRNLVFAGLAMGALLLIRPSAVPFVALVFPWYAWVRRRQKQKVFSPLCVLIFSATLVMLPWVARNYSVFDRFIPLTTGGPRVLHWGIQWNSVDRDRNAVGLTDKKHRTELEKRDEYMRIFTAYIKENPGRYLKLMVQKAAVFWSLYFPQWSARHKTVKGVFFVVIFGLSLLGLLSSRLDREYAAIFWIYLLSTTLLIMVTVVDYDNRFRVPVEAILSVTAALGFFRAREIWVGRRRQNPAEKNA
jgi:4-amino-4-deoxy-L-arabinose transferase-like glycosyltransferase